MADPDGHDGHDGHDLVLPSPSLIVLAGPPASGKSTWAQRDLGPATVSSDDLRALAGEGPSDMRASDMALDLLDTLVEERMRRRLTTVVDTLGTDAGARARWRAAANAAGVPTVVVLFDTTATTCRTLNRSRDKRVPDDVLRRALQAWPEQRDQIEAEPFDQVVTYAVGSAARVRTASAEVAAAQSNPVDATRTPGATGLRFGLHIGRFDWATHPTGGEPLREIAAAAEQAGFASIWVMDHFRQIPQVGRAWDPMLETWTTLAHLAACTRSIGLGSLVTCVSHRNAGLLAKSVATVDVLSGGRVTCGLGAGWFTAEQTAYGYRDRTVAERLDLLEDTLEVLPLLWGKGSPAYEGRVIQLPEAMAYPRPIQDPLPLLVGGGGERRTLRLAATHAHACNLMGDPKAVAHKLAVLDRHCHEVGRDPAEVGRTTLSTALVGLDADDLQRKVDRLRPGRMSAERFAATQSAGTVDDQIARYRTLGGLGIDTTMVSLTDLDLESVTRFGAVIEAVGG